MSVNWLEAIGYCGTLATVVSYSMRTIVPLRVTSILSSVFFIAYAAAAGVWPMLATELVLLPLNCVRLIQDTRPRLAARAKSGRTACPDDTGLLAAAISGYLPLR